MAFSLRAQAELARAKGKSALADMLDREAMRFDTSRATVVPGTLTCIHPETP
jgi:hypothetical protein